MSYFIIQEVFSSLPPSPPLSPPSPSTPHHFHPHLIISSYTSTTPLPHPFLPNYHIATSTIPLSPFLTSLLPSPFLSAGSQHRPVGWRGRCELAGHLYGSDLKKSSRSLRSLQLMMSPDPSQKIILEFYEDCERDIQISTHVYTNSLTTSANCHNF